MERLTCFSLRTMLDAIDGSDDATQGKRLDDAAAAGVFARAFNNANAQIAKPEPTSWLF